MILTRIERPHIRLRAARGPYISRSKMKKFATQIYDAVMAGKLAEPFDAAMVRRACPGWSEKSYGVFLSKHAVGNGANTELFVRVRPGSYRLKISN